MPRTAPALLVLALVLALPAQAQRPSPAQAQKKVYCWDQGGRRVCGDALPAEASGKARTEISSRSGLTTGRVERTPTEEERSAAAVAAELAQRQAEAEAAAARRDLAMVESYLTEAELRRAYGERTALLDETLKTTTLAVDNLRQSLLGLLRQAGDVELERKPVPKRLADNIVLQHQELARQRQAIINQQAERAQLEVELNDAVARYRLLKGEPPEAEAAATPAPSASTPPAASATR